MDIFVFSFGLNKFYRTEETCRQKIMGRFGCRLPNDFHKNYYFWDEQACDCMKGTSDYFFEFVFFLSYSILFFFFFFFFLLVINLNLQQVGPLEFGEVEKRTLSPGWKENLLLSMNGRMLCLS